jgi:DNA-binding beta-propeller fold protein YncE
MKRIIHKDTKQNKRHKLSKEREIINTLYINRPKSIVQTHCSKFLIGVEGNSIFRYNLKTKQKFRIAGSVCQRGHQDGTRNETRFDLPQDLTLSKDLKTLFIADWGNCVIRTICVGTGITSTLAGQVGRFDNVDSSKEKACFKYARHLKLSPDGNTLFVADYCDLRTICITTGQVDTICTKYKFIQDFELSPDGKHIYILNLKQCLKYNLKTNKSEIILEGQGFFWCKLSKNGQLLFISNRYENYIQVINTVKDDLIDTITTNFKPSKISNSISDDQLFVCYFENNNIQVLDISKYCTNFKTFLQLQLSKQSFLSRSLIKRFN